MRWPCLSSSSVENILGFRATGSQTSVCIRITWWLGYTTAGRLPSQRFWSVGLGWGWEFAFLTHPQVVLICEPHFENEHFAGLLKRGQIYNHLRTLLTAEPDSVGSASLTSSQGSHFEQQDCKAQLRISLISFSEEENPFSSLYQWFPNLSPHWNPLRSFIISCLCPVPRLCLISGMACALGVLKDPQVTQNAKISEPLL